MRKTLKVLMIEDSEMDSALLTEALEHSGYDVQTTRIETEKDLRLCLQENWDIILSDYNLPAFSGLKALQVLAESAQDIPTIIVSGIIGEERAASVIKAGAHDFIMKDNLSRLGPAVEIQILEWKVRAEKRRTDRALRESEERMRVLVDGIKDYAIFMLSPEGHLQSWNNGVQRILGYAEDEFIGLPFATIFTSEDQAAGVPEAELAAAIREGRAESERWCMRKNGTSFWVSGATNALRGADGELLGFAKIMRDETERKASTEERERLYFKAQEANRIKDEFLATLSHELRTPLNAIIGFSELLSMDSPDSEDFAYSLDAIHRNAQMQNQLITDLLDVSRIITGKLTLDMQPVQLADVLQEAMVSVQLAARSKGISITTEFAAEPRPVLGDKTRLQQVFWNLLNNAVKFTPNSGRILVRLHSTDGRLLIDVEDNGRGIEPDFLPYVFERFRQEDGSKTRHFGGLGLGLAIVRHIVEAHGGTVHVTSRGKNQGAKFTVYLLPLAKASEGAEPPYASPGLDKKTRGSHPFCSDILRGRHVLIVDDQRDARELIRRVMDRAEAFVMEAASAEEALERLAGDKPDLIICDIGLPDEDGYSLLRRIREQIDPDRLIPTIALTAYVREEDRNQALAASFDIHLGKPILPTDLLEASSSLLQKHLELMQTSPASATVMT
ncbi:MAG TPA: response regulator [Oligoflexus sp.]|uniref:hybrid sensor histidine kinase/response regulator n=1 Tax=Oligoflexus sp. TaxID=1971216 RepID=UPI002D7E7EE3|nr:response regulator [Oligoflexus sp.]HET9240218.1 response regulator [Oligoflexus sp.]